LTTAGDAADKKTQIKAGESRFRMMMKKHLLTWIPFVILAVGLALLLYPTLSDWWNTKHESQAVAGYIRHVANLSRTENEQMLEQARAYNKTLIGRGSDRFEMTAAEEKEYDSLLDVTGTGIMGYVDIPKINIKLPIYHGVDESVLQVAIGHIPGSSLPVGGEGTHAVISGHRGLPSARLFTDIDKLSVGDSFYIQVLDETLTYEVDQIRTVLPDELQNLTIDPKEDYCTLVTCTPYGVNTHRLLVRGHRVENAKSDVKVAADAVQIDPDTVAWIVAGALIAVWFVISMIRAARRKKKQS
jgi:sortase A